MVRRRSGTKRMVDSREALPRDTRDRRLLLSLYGLGANAGLKRVANLHRALNIEPDRLNEGASQRDRPAPCATPRTAPCTLQIPSLQPWLSSVVPPVPSIWVSASVILSRLAKSTMLRVSMVVYLSLVGMLSFNNNSTRYAANLQIPETPDSVIARSHQWLL